MRSNRKLLFGIAIILAAIVILEIGMLVMRSGGSGTAANTVAVNTPAPGPGTPVVLPSGNRLVAQTTQDIPAGTIITPGMFAMKPKAGTADVSQYINNDKEVLGYVTRVQLTKGADLQPEDLLGHITDVGIAIAIRPGYKAMSIAIPNKPTIHDLVKVGNYVDIIAAFQGQESRPVVENVRVLAVDVTGADYPPTSVAMRGPYRAEPKGGFMPGVAPPPAGPGGAPAPTPTPTPGPQNPTPPAAALTLEVTMKQANILQLTQASNANFDFLLRPASPSLSPVAGATPEPEESIAEKSVTIPQIAPYNARLKAIAAGDKKKDDAAVSGLAKGLLSGSMKGSGNKPPPPGPIYNGGGGPGPMPVATPGPPATYDIPIYADGQPPKVNTVPNPAAYAPAK